MNLTAPKGFTANAVRAGIRGKDRLDLGLIASEVPAAAAGVFTRNLVKAAPVLYDMELLKSGRARAILVNSGIANACTGETGMEHARACGKMAAAAAGMETGEVLVTSTGVIGEFLDLSCFSAHMDELAAGLAPDGFERVARAMMTTDTVPKTAARTAVVGGVETRLLGLAKGAGMIHPDMATMLAFVLTDAAIDAPLLRELLVRGVNTSFNRITVDGDTSTNDSVLILANGMAGNPPPATGDEAASFTAALNSLLDELALMIVRDGEGATKLIHVRVQGAASDADAARAAETVATSSLVKTAFFGCDANWGRIAAALGRSGAGFDPARLRIAFGDVVLVENGLATGNEAEARAGKVLQQDEIDLNIDLGAGPGTAVYHTSDLSIGYVKINADYRT